MPHKDDFMKNSNSLPVGLRDLLLKKNDDMVMSGLESMIEEQAAKQGERNLGMQVGQLERAYKDLEGFLGTIIATLNVDGNAHLFDGLPEEWHDLVDEWTKRYKRMTNG
jgi:hypothetical protein